MPGIGCDGHYGLGGCLEQEAIDSLLVPVSDLGNLCRQGEDKMEVLDRQQVLLLRRHPVTCGRSLAFGTMPVLAGIVGDVTMAAIVTGRHMPAERIGTAGFDRRHHLELGEADMSGIGLSPCRPMRTKNVSDLQLWTRQ